MHVEHCHTTVDDLHIQIAQDVSDCSATTCIYLTEFCGLEGHICVIHDFAHFSHIFCACIVGTGLAA